MAQFDDILLTEPDEELQATVDGDFVTGDGANKFIKYLVVGSPGHYKMSPRVGVGIYNYLHATMTPAQVERNIRAQLEADIFVKPKIDARQFPDNGKIFVNKVQLTIA